MNQKGIPFRFLKSFLAGGLIFIRKLSAQGRMRNTRSVMGSLRCTGCGVDDGSGSGIGIGMPFRPDVIQKDGRLVIHESMEAFMY